MKYMRLSKAQGAAADGDDVPDDASEAESTVSATTRHHRLAQTKLHASIQTHARRAERELLPKIERLTHTAAATTKLGEDLAQAMDAELDASSAWAGVAGATSAPDPVDRFLFHTLCQALCRADGRDAVLQYVVAAIDEIEGGGTSDEED